MNYPTLLKPVEWHGASILSELDSPGFAVVRGRHRQPTRRPLAPMSSCRRRYGQDRYERCFGRR